MNAQQPKVTLRGFGGGGGGGVSTASSPGVESVETALPFLVGCWVKTGEEERRRSSGKGRSFVRSRAGVSAVASVLRFGVCKKKTIGAICTCIVVRCDILIKVGVLVLKVI